KQVVGYNPLPAAAVSPKVGTGHEKYSPADEPAPSFRSCRAAGKPVRIGTCEKIQDLPAMSVHVPEPGFRCLPIVDAADLPVIVQPQIALKIKEQIVARHDAAGKKMLRHPIAAIANLEGIRVAQVAEDVNEELGVGL